jgi:pimeloyl-ACP methyl ester carboxylesterase
MIPGSAALCVSAITVPVFLGIGDRDIARQPRHIPADFANSADLTVYVIPNAGHNHNVEPTRALLWDRLAAWAFSLKPQRQSDEGSAFG